MMKSVYKLTLIILFFAFAQVDAHAATLSGFVKDADTKQAVVNANVILKGTNFGAASDLDGEYLIIGIEPGVYNVIVTSIGYSDTSETDFNIYEDTKNELNFDLRSTTILLKEATIIAKAKKGTNERELADRFKTASISDAISGEQIKRLPDPDVAHVVRRTVGVSTVGGDPIIRGLGVRYSKVTLNSSYVSGTQPNRSGVSLELFPASMMNKVSVTKSYLPDQYGEFGSGIVNMSTWEFPGKAEYRFSGSIGFNTISTFRNDFVDYEGGKWDWIGLDDGTRAMPAEVENSEYKLAKKGRFTENGYTAEELEEFAELFSNNWSGVDATALPAGNLSASYANSTKKFKKKFGYMVSGLYKNSSNYRESNRRIFKTAVGGLPELQHWYTFESYKQSITTGLLSAMQYEVSPLNKLNLNVMLNRDVDDEVRYYEGFNGDRSNNVRDTRLRMVAQSVSTAQFSGHHVVPSLAMTMVDWQATYSLGRRYEPDTREVQYEILNEDVGYELADENQSGSHFFNELSDNTRNLNLSLVYPFDMNNKLKIGGSYMSKSRDFSARKFQFERDSRSMRADNFDFTADPETIFAPENIHADAWTLRESTRYTDAYSADQELSAAFLMADLQVLPKVRIIGGARLENSTQNLTTYELFTASATPLESEISTEDILPAGNIIYSYDDEMNFRFAASQTVSRPDFRELSPFEFTDILGGHAVKGEPGLKRAKIQHYDLRWEKKHHGVNLVAVSVFYKRFKDPIEEVVIGAAQNVQTFANAESAENYGLELEIRQRLGVFDPRLNYWGVSSNLTLLNSDIRVDSTEGGLNTSDNRPLHGQSPYLFNLGLNFNYPETGTQADLFYHVFGKRIHEVGANGLPDIYEMPHPDLDLVVKQPLSSRWSGKFAWKNMLNSEVRFEQAGDFTEKYRVGSTFSVGLSYKN